MIKFKRPGRAENAKRGRLATATWGNLISPAKLWKSSHFIVFATYKFYIPPDTAITTAATATADPGVRESEKKKGINVYIYTCIRNTLGDPRCCSCMLCIRSRVVRTRRIFIEKQKTAPPEKCGPLVLS